MDRSTTKMLARAGPILARIPNAPFVFVEVGVHRGQLAQHLLRERSKLTWHGVDPWWHAPNHASKAYLATGDGHAIQTKADSNRFLRETLRSVEPFGARANVIEMPSPAAAGAFEHASVDAVFLDADHSYEAVSADIAAWWPIVRPGGWLGGHDYRHRDKRFDFTGVDRAVDQFAARVGLPVEFDDEDGGGIPLGAVWFVRKNADA
jgi:Methyltransferase domain